MEEIFLKPSLRCNYVIPLAICPDISQNALPALTTVTDLLLGPLGLATLHPGDWAYRGDYDNSNQSEDGSIAHGANYHQGPEWLWPVGFYLRALLNVTPISEVFTKGRVKKYLLCKLVDLSIKWVGGDPKNPKDFQCSLTVNFVLYGWVG